MWLSEAPAWPQPFDSPARVPECCWPPASVGEAPSTALGLTLEAPVAWESPSCTVPTELRGLGVLISAEGRCAVEISEGASARREVQAPSAAGPLPPPPA